ncbi:MAG TPA: hypothetical protein VF773_18690 [Verrucomicrobiae bacterium]
MTPRKVVFAPDVLVAALFDPRARHLVNEWRDGQIVPVVTRELLVLYLRTLAGAGLTPELLHKWSLWLTTPGKAIFIEQNGTAARNHFELCRAIAEAQNAEVVTTRQRQNQAS